MCRDVHVAAEVIDDADFVSTLFACFLIPLATVPARIVYAKTDGPALVRALKATARLHLWVGVALAAAVSLAP